MVSKKKSKDQNRSELLKQYPDLFYKEKKNNNMKSSKLSSESQTTRNFVNYPENLYSIHTQKKKKQRYIILSTYPQYFYKFDSEKQTKIKS